MIEAPPSITSTSSNHSHWHESSGLVRPNRPPIHKIPRTAIDPERVQFATWWVGLGVPPGLAALWLIKQYGWPAFWSFVGLGVAGLGYVRWFEPAHPQLQQFELSFPDLPAALDGVRIGQLSDMHLGEWYTLANLRQGVAWMEQHQPDLIVLNGDLVHDLSPLSEALPILQRLHAPLGVYAVPGNHDHWEGIEDVRGVLSLAGIRLLVNRGELLLWNGAPIWLAGVDDMWEGVADLDAAFAGAPDQAFRVLLAHEPDLADAALEYGVRLQLSGHTHGGHLRLPWLGPFALPRYGTRYGMGHYQVGPLQLYVSRGLGGAPLRLLCRPEAAIITLRRR